MGGMIDASTMLSTFAQSIPGFEALLNSFVALAGVVLTGMAIFKAIEVDKAGGASQGMSWSTPVLYLLCGAALFNFASSVDMALETLWGGSTSVKNLMSYKGSGAMPAQTSEMIGVLVLVLRLYGYITYARGWLSLRKLGHGQNGNDENFKKSMIRLVAGVGLINLVGTANLISSTFGFGDVL